MWYAPFFSSCPLVHSVRTRRMTMLRPSLIFKASPADECARLRFPDLLFSKTIVRTPRILQLSNAGIADHRSFALAYICGAGCAALVAALLFDQTAIQNYLGGNFARLMVLVYNRLLEQQNVA